MFFFKDFFIRKFSRNSSLFVDYYYWLIPLTVSYTFFLLFEAYAWLIQKTVASNLVKELVNRIWVTLIFVLYFFHLFSKDTFVKIYAFIYVPSILILLWISTRNGGIRFVPRISTVTKRLYKKIISFSAFHFSGSIVRILPLTLSALMIASINGLSDTAIYTAAIYLISIMEVPQRSMLSITTSIIGEAWKNKDLKKIEEIYHKTSLNLLIAGLGIFGVVYLNVENLVRFEGNSYAPIITIFTVMGISKIIDLGMGMNDQIMALSKYWRIDFFLSISFIIINIPLTYFLIKRFGLYGSAYGQFISLVFFNVMRFITIWKLFKLQPFTIKSLYIILLAALIILPIRHFIPFAGNLYLDTIIRTIIYVVLLGAAVIGFRLSPDIFEVYLTFLKRLGIKKGGR
jgi:O-antigen/teichoic acid export membrane protein